MKLQKLGFAGVQFLAYISFSLCMSNFIPYMATLGYTSFQRGFSLSAYAVLTIVLQIVFGVLSDRFQTSKWIAIVALLSLGLGAVALFGWAQHSLLIVIVVVGVCGGLVNSLCGLLDTWIMGLGLRMVNSLSRIKIFGSIGWTLGSLASVLLLRWLGYKGIALFVFVFIGAAVVLSYRLPDIEKQKKKSGEKVDLGALMSSRSYLFLVMVLFCLYSLVVANTGIVVDKMLALNATQFEISLKWAMGSLLEIPMYFYSMKLIERYGNQKLLLLTAGVLFLQFLGFALANKAVWIVVLSSLQALTTPIILMTSKLLIVELFPPKLQSSSQLIAMSFYMGGSSLVIPVLSGVLSRWVSYDVILYGYAVVAFMTLLFYHRRYKSYLR